MGDTPSSRAAADPQDGDSPEARPSQAEALAAASASGERVEISPETTEDKQVFAEPDGSLTAELTSGPVRAMNASGEWAEIDTDLVETGGRLVPKNVPVDITFSAGGDQSFAKADPAGDGTSADLVWQWPTQLPEPTVDGPTATYPNAVVGGGDLVVIATPTGFTHNVVLHEAPADDATPLQFTVPVTTPGAEILETMNGGLEVKDDSSGKRLLTAPAPLMYDASGTDANDPAVSPVNTTVVDTPSGGQIVLKPDMEFLTDPDTEYPVTVDPTFTAPPLYAIADTWVDSGSNQNTQSTSPELRVGTTNAGATKARSFLKFNGDDTWRGNTINSATLTMRNFASGNCTASSIQAARIYEKAWSSLTLTWDNQPLATTNNQSYYAPAAGADGCASANATWGITAMTQAWADGYPNYGIRLAAVNEASNNTYRRYRSAEYTDYDGTFRPKLVVNYTAPDTTAPAVPAVVSPLVDAEIIDPLPPAHAFALSSQDDTAVSSFYVTKDGGTAQAVSAHQNAASYPWSPGPGPHTLSVIAADSAGNQSAPKTLTFTVREYHTLTSPVIVYEGTLPPGETTAALGPVENLNWEEVDTFGGYLDVTGWTVGESGTLAISDSQGAYPTNPQATWTSGDDSAAGKQINVTLAPRGENALTILNTSNSNVHVKVSIAEWRKMVALPGDADPADEGDNGDLGEDGTEPDEGNPLEGESAADDSTAGEIACSVSADDPDIVDCTSEVPVATTGESFASAPDPAPEAGIKDSNDPTYAAAASDPTIADPGPRPCRATTVRWAHTRFAACHLKTVRVDQFRVNSDNSLRSVGFIEYQVSMRIEMGPKTRRINTSMWARLYRAEGTLDYPDVGVRLALRCTNSADCDAGEGTGYQADYLNAYVNDSTPTFTHRVYATIPNWVNTTDVKTNYFEDYRLTVKTSWFRGKMSKHTDSYEWGDVFVDATVPRVSAFLPWSNIVRCDNAYYFNQRAGCRVVAHEPTLTMSLSNQKLDEAADFYRDVQVNFYPWGLHDWTWFTRANAAEMAANYNEACRYFRGSMTCDEFPFKFTKQGCFTNRYATDGSRGKSCRTRNMPSSQNSYAGTVVSRFLQSQRILRDRIDEQFYFRVVS